MKHTPARRRKRADKQIKIAYLKTHERKRIPRIVMLILSAILYVVLFAPAHTTDSGIQPAWITAPLAPKAATTPIPPSSVPFFYNRLFGYISPDGMVAALQPISYGVTYSGERYSAYAPINHPITIRNSDGSIAQSIEHYGYPLLENERTLVLHQNGHSISEWNQHGELWRKDFSTIIMATDTSDTLTAISFFSGEAAVVDQSGEYIARLQIPDVQNPLLSAITLSEEQSMVATYDAKSNQIFLFAFEALTRVVEIHSTARSYLAFPYLAFLPMSSNIIYYDGVNLYLYHFEQERLILLQRAHSLIDIDTNEFYVAFITRDIAHTLLSIYTHDGTLYLQSYLTDRSATSDHTIRFHNQHTPSFMLGVENRIVSFAYLE